MSEPLRCVVCGVELMAADGEDAVRTDAGPVHRECFEGPVPPPNEPDFDKADVEMRRMEQDERDYGGRYDEEGRV